MVKVPNGLLTHWVMLLSVLAKGNRFITSWCAKLGLQTQSPRVRKLKGLSSLQMMNFDNMVVLSSMQNQWFWVHQTKSPYHTLQIVLGTIQGEKWHRRIKHTAGPTADLLFFMSLLQSQHCCVVKARSDLCVQTSKYNADSRSIRIPTLPHSASQSISRTLPSPLMIINKKL